MRISSLEGSSFSGKTELAKKFRLLHEVEVVNAYTDYFIRHNRSIVTGAQEVKNPILAFEKYLEVERFRSEDVERANALGKTVLLDKSVIALYAYQLAVGEQSDNESHPYMVDYALDRIKEEVGKGDIIIPDCVNIIVCENKSIFETRKQTRGGVVNNGIFNNWSFSQLLTSTTHRAAAALLGDTNMIFEYKSNNSEENTSEIYLGILGCIAPSQSNIDLN